jgi:hypothetical protein
MLATETALIFFIFLKKDDLKFSQANLILIAILNLAAILNSFFGNKIFYFFFGVCSLRICKNFCILKFLTNARASRKRCKKKTTY